jgi:hypothetical protein
MNIRNVNDHNGLRVFTDLDEFAEYTAGAQWADGFPLLPPEPQLVSEALGTVPLSADAVLGVASTTGVVVTVQDAAIATILAGCLPGYLPVVVAAVAAFFDNVESRDVGLGGVADSSQCVVVNGPIRNEIDVNCGLGLYGPGWRANATIGRTLQIVVRFAFGRGEPSFGDPGQFTLCFGEDEESTDWVPLHVERGCAPGSSAVTVHSSLVMSMSHDRHSTTPEEFLDTLVVYGRGKVSGSSWFPGSAVSLMLVIPDEARRLLGAWSKDDIRAYLYPRLTADDGTPIQPVALGSPDHILIVAAGGRAFSATQFFLSHIATPNTRIIGTKESAI